MPQSHGSANKSIGGIYADKSTVTVAEGGAVQGNKASMGGGIYMNASSAAVAKGSALYNNKAAYGGDDLFAFGDNTLFLPDAKSMSGDRKLTGDGKEITGWFYLAMQEATNSHDYERNAKWAAADEQWTAPEQ